MSVENVRTLIMESLLTKPVLGENYIDWHTENAGECGLTVKLEGQEFDIIIKVKSEEVI